MARTLRGLAVLASVLGLASASWAQQRGAVLAVSPGQEIVVNAPLTLIGPDGQPVTGYQSNGYYYPNGNGQSGNVYTGNGHSGQGYSGQGYSGNGNLSYGASSHPRIQACLNKHGLGCESHHHWFGCGNFQSEFTFIFGSCRSFYGQPCDPITPGTHMGGKLNPFNYGFMGGKHGGGKHGGGGCANCNR